MYRGRKGHHTTAIAGAAFAAALAMGTAEAGGNPELNGQWEGRWNNGGARIAMTVANAEQDTPDVTYCFKKRCWSPSNVAIEGNAVTFTAKGGLKYRMELDDGKIKAQLRKGGRTFRGRMKRVAE